MMYFQGISKKKKLDSFSQIVLLDLHQCILFLLFVRYQNVT